MWVSDELDMFGEMSSSSDEDNEDSTAVEADNS